MNVVQEKKYLTVYWDRYSKNNFWYIWLYDNAPTNRHQNGQKLTHTYEISPNIQPKSVHWDTAHLYITWNKEPIVYPISWLKKSVPSMLIPSSKPNLWIQRQNHPIFDYADLLADQKTLLACLKEVKIYGFTRIKNVPTQSGFVLNLVDLFGYVRETNYGKFYDVIAKKNPENLADTSLGLAPHTDNPYRNPTPTIQLLHCLKADVHGGQTILVDGFYAAYKLKKEKPYYFQLLTKHPIQFKFSNEQHFLENWATVLELNHFNQIHKIKFNNRSVQPFILPDKDVLPYYQAYQYFEKLLHTETYQTQFKLNPGEAIIYDNERILHGRTAYELWGERHLQGCYADRDALLSKIRILESVKYPKKIKYPVDI